MQSNSFLFLFTGKPFLELKEQMEKNYAEYCECHNRITANPELVSHDSVAVFKSSYML